MFRCSNNALFFLFLVVGLTQETTVTAKLLLRRDGSANANANGNGGGVKVKTLEEKEQNRLLMSKKSNYTDPVWFDAYKESAGKAFRRCKFQNNVAPADGSECRKLRPSNVDYNCAFGDQTCPDGSIQPKTSCFCDVSAGIWSCEEYKPCEVTPPVTTCPKEHPVTFNPPLTCVQGLICPIGKQRCCGDKFPLYICTCKNGVFDCDNDKSCAGPCPGVSPGTSVPTSSPVNLPVPTMMQDATRPPTMMPDPTSTPQEIVTAPPNPRTFTCPNAGSNIPPERGSPCNVDESVSCRYGKSCWYVLFFSR